MSLKVLQISTVCRGGSVGRIMVDIYRTLEENKDTPIIAYGRRDADPDLNAFRFGNNLDMGLHVLATFFKGEHGFASAKPTKKLIEQIRIWNPDVIHLHNIHGFVLQTELLFDYLKSCGKPVVWTLHDCWSYTGHCAFYDYTSCEGWKEGCTHCSQYRRTYPYALFKNNTAGNFARKKEAFTGVPNLTLVVPSRWLGREVGMSFLKDYPVKVIPNGVDQDSFRPCPKEETDALRSRYQLDKKFLILGVANVWERRKGLDYFLKLSEILPEDMQIVLIGLSEKQIRKLPANVIGLERTASMKELALWYSAADVFVNATLEDNFPTTNLEAISCGTPVITFATGGSPESLDETCGRVVQKGDLEGLCLSIMEEQKHPMHPEDCLKRAALYEKNRCFGSYIDLYYAVSGDKTN